MNETKDNEFSEINTKNKNNVVEITSKPLIQSDEDSDEVDEYESSDNDEVCENDNGKIDNMKYHNSLLYGVLNSNIDSEHESNDGKRVHYI